MRRTPQQPGEAQASQAAGELEELLRGLHRRRRGSPQASDRSDVYMQDCLMKLSGFILTQSPSRVRRRAQPAHPLSTTAAPSSPRV
jgi:hypothetical protein